MMRVRNFAFAALLLAFVASSLGAQVYINEYCNDPFGTVGLDCNADGFPATSVQQSDDEFVEIVNAGPGTVNIGGWQLWDAVQLRHTFATGTMLAPGAAIVVFGGGDVTTFNTFGAGTGVLASSGAIGLNNSNDSVVLYDATMTMVDVYAYGSGPANGDGDGESITRATDMATDLMVAHTTVPSALAHSAGYKNDGVTPWLPATTPPPVLATYPGNLSDFDVVVSINGTADTNPTRVISCNAGDIVNLWYNSPNSGTELQPFSVFYQLFFTGASLFSQVIPGETPPGGFWLDSNNPSAATTILVLVDGLGLGGPAFLAPILPSFGYDFAFVMPASVGGQGLSLFFQGVIADPGLNSFNLGIDDAIELVIN